MRHSSKPDAEDYAEGNRNRERGIDVKVVGLQPGAGFDLRSTGIGRAATGPAPRTSRPRRMVNPKRMSDIWHDEGFDTIMCKAAVRQYEAQFPDREAPDPHAEWEDLPAHFRKWLAANVNKPGFPDERILRANPRRKKQRKVRYTCEICGKLGTHTGGAPVCEKCYLEGC
jgi:hypothetical protein